MRNELNLWGGGGDMRQAKAGREAAGRRRKALHARLCAGAAGRAGRGGDGGEPGGAALADCVVLPLPAAGEAACSTRPCPGGSTLALVLDACGRGR